MITSMNTNAIPSMFSGMVTSMTTSAIKSVVLSLGAIMILVLPWGQTNGKGWAFQSTQVGQKGYNGSKEKGRRDVLGNRCDTGITRQTGENNMQMGNCGGFKLHSTARADSGQGEIEARK